jgi:hypothetical protein
MGKMKMIKLLILGSIFSLLFTSCLLFTLFYPKRHFYKVGNMEFTFWGTSDGTYITPYKYTGTTIPKNDYMIVSSSGGIIIYIGEDLTLNIFPSTSAKIIEINLTSYKFELFPFINEIDAIRARSDKARYFKGLGYPFISFNLSEMYVITYRS